MKLPHIFLLLLMVSCGGKQEIDFSDYGKDKSYEDTSSQTSTIPKNGFKLMSFNVRYANSSDESAGNGWTKRVKGVIAMLKEQKPLVMGTQECLVTQRKDILDGVPGYSAFGPGREDGKEKGETMSIFYVTDSLDVIKSGTFWLCTTPDTPGVKGWDAACVRCCTWARFRHKRLGKEFYYFNTHLDHKGKTARQEEMKLIESKIKEFNTDGLPCVLTADFNTTENDAIFNDILKFMNNARITAPMSDSAGTYRGFNQSSNSRIDHIFYSGFGIDEYKTVTDSYAGINCISDHCPIYAIFKFN